MKFYKKIQKEYEQIQQFFKTTTEAYDELEWNGKILQVWLQYQIIESYSRRDLLEIGIITSN